MTPAYRYQAKLHRVIDGDTVDLIVDLGFTVKVQTRFRLLDLDTPEIRGPEREEGIAARLFLEELLTRGPLTVESHKTGKYGRWLAELWIGTLNINGLMREWCEQNHADQSLTIHNDTEGDDGR
jgi:micrococcal nuclease